MADYHERSARRADGLLSSASDAMIDRESQARQNWDTCVLATILGTLSGCGTPATQPPPQQPSQDIPTKATIELPPLPPSAEFPPGPVLQNQSFLTSEVRIAVGPWPPLDAPAEDPQIEAVRRWLIANRAALGTWPPQFTSHADAEQTIVAWRQLRPAVRQVEESAYKNLNSTHVLATYYYFGHNLDEAGAGPRASALIRRSIAANPRSAFATALLGFLDLHASPGKSSEETFRRALEMDPTPKLRALINVGLGAACAISWKPHRSLMYFDEALRESPSLLDEYRALTNVARQRFDPSTSSEWGPRQIFSFHEENLESTFFGFSMTLPDGWQVDRASHYEPNRPAIIYLDAPPLEDSGLIHGMVIVPKLLQGPEDEATFLKQLQHSGATVQTMAPLIESSHLGQWHLLTSDMQVGSQGDLVQMLYVEATVLQQPWSREEHLVAAQSEGECAPPPIPVTEPSESATVLQHSPLRANSPVKIAITYNASLGTIDRAREQFREILKTLQFQDRAGTTVGW